MQQPITGTPHEWFSQILRFLTELGVLAGGLAVYKKYFSAGLRAFRERNKPAAEVREINANIELKLVKAQIDASEMLRHQNQNLMEANDYALSLAAEVAQLRRDVEMLRSEKRLLYAQNQQCIEIFKTHPELRVELDKLIKTSNG